MTTPPQHPQDPSSQGQHPQSQGHQSPPPPLRETPPPQGSVPPGPPPAQGHSPYENPHGHNPQSGPYVPPSQLKPSEERNLGMLAHLVPAVLLPLSAGTLGFVGSLVIFLMYKNRGPFVRQHAANSLNVQIITAILLILSSLLMFVLIGFLFYPLVIIVAVVIHVIGAVKANNGEWWAPPLTPTFVS